MMQRSLRMTRLLLAFLMLVASAPAFAVSQLETKLVALSGGGNGEAAYHLGMLYHMGLGGVRKDQRKAYELFKVSAERGDPLGAYKLGCFYAGQGEGVVEADLKLALKYKMIAAEAGYALAQEDVARHLFGEGDTAGGLRWLEAASAQGGLMPLMALGGLYSGQVPKGIPSLPVDTIKSWTYFLLASRDTPEMKQGFEEEAQKKLSKEDYNSVMKNVSIWRKMRSPLTQKADRGLAAAYILAGLPVPAN